MHRTATTITALVAAAVLAVGATGTAVASGLIGSPDVANNSLRSKDVRDGTIKARDLFPSLVERIDAANTGPQGPAGKDGRNGTNGVDGKAGTNGVDGRDGVIGLESDGPYPGATRLTDGDNSTTAWAAGEFSRSWVMCPTGKYALGGGFTAASDASVADKLATRITTSQPAQIVNGNPDAYSPIEGDADGSYLPNGWLVEGRYDGANGSVIVRPHVVCATVPGQ